MQKIKQLPLQEVQKIAAGQVVERPANVIKELIENSLDAGATTISVYCTQAGQKLIRVVDNGCGMSPEDALFCFERHATSKLYSFDQLSTLCTFGFRGEALYTIGAVSSVTLVTKECGAATGSKVFFNQGVLKTSESAACSFGTDISIVDLFDNVPARKKFLKKEETEWRVITQLFQAFCFSHTTVHFQLYSDDRLVYNCPPVTTLTARCAQLWDMHTADNLLESEKDEPIIEQCVISPHHLFRYNKNQLFFFVNKRWVRNYELTHAVLKGYCNVLPPGRYPIAIVDITLDPALVDSNIHPRKEEVKFVNQKIVEHAITALVKKTLEKKVSTQLHQSVSHKQEPLLQTPYISPAMPEVYSFKKTIPEIYVPCEAQHGDFGTAKNFNFDKQYKNVPEIPQVIHNQQSFHADTAYTVLGVYNKTYIILEQEDGLLFIDQHAAHERILFEKFSTKFTEIASTTLLFPETLHFSSCDVDILMQHSLLLAEHGIIYDRMAENALVVTSIPVHLKSIRWMEFFQEMLDIFSEHAHLEHEEFLKQVNKKLQAQMACKAAVKAGDVLTTEQIQNLLRDLNVLENRLTCPHGRPTSWLLPLLDIEKKFKRKL